MPRRSVKESLSTREIEFINSPLVETAAAKPAPEPTPVAPPKKQSVPVRAKRNQSSKKISDATPSQPFSSRIPSRLQSGLRRAALNRTERGEQPNTVQDILAEAVLKWLEKNEPHAIRSDQPDLSDG